MTLLLLLLFAADFTDVAEEAGLKGVSAGRAVFVDLDGDGALDVVLDRQHFFLQREGKFQPVAGLSIVSHGVPPGVPDVVLFADFDNDGDADCFVTAVCEPENPKWEDHGRSNGLFLNDGKGAFTATPLAMPRLSCHAATTLDFDGDGALDLFVGSGYVVYGASLESHPDRLWRGNGKGGFADVTEAMGLLTVREAGRRDSSKPTYGVTHGDFDGDGWTDLWVCTYGRQWNFLWKNEGGKRFRDIAEATGFDGDADLSGIYPPATKTMWKERFGAERQDEPPFRSNGNTFDCAIADFDNDGDLDCILAEITHAWAGPSSDRTSLLVQEQGRFLRRPDAFARTHEGPNWNQGDIHCGWIDFDNDGLLDALIASSDYPDRQELKLYRQRPDHTFEEARTFGWEGAGQISVGDYDNDGDQDILAGRSLMRLSKEKREELTPSCALFRNDLANGNRWLQILCEGKSANRDGIGCRIEVTTADGTTRTREIRGGHGHAGHNDPPVAHFGLGKHDEAVEVRVRWPARSSKPTLLKGVKAGQRLVVRQSRTP